ncbi:MAG TPA: hypothetical protein VFE25_01800 [Opitutaceae bacterium]|jgi:hypothetical protein|nr:hypothetical protein [Opitutaceae bacterium]
MAAFFVGSLRAETSPLLSGALQRWLAGQGDLAFTEHTRVFHRDGSLKEERVERFDPSQPENRRWRLVELGGVPITEAQSARWEAKKNAKPRQKVDKSPIELFDLDHAVQIGDAPTMARFRVPVRSPIPHLVPTNEIEVVVTVDKKTGSVAGIGAALREPIPVLLGVVRITDLDVNLHIHPEANALASDSEGVEPGSTARMTISKLGYSMQYNWSDFTRVPLAKAN